MNAQCYCKFCLKIGETDLTSEGCRFPDIPIAQEDKSVVPLFKFLCSTGLHPECIADDDHGSLLHVNIHLCMYYNLKHQFNPDCSDAWIYDWIEEGVRRERMIYGDSVCSELFGKMVIGTLKTEIRQIFTDILCHSFSSPARDWESR